MQFFYKVYKDEGNPEFLYTEGALAEYTEDVAYIDAQIGLAVGDFAYAPGGSDQGHGAQEPRGWPKKPRTKARAKGA
eukprot:3548143-Lingulodinium_polyedra.AAC.1